MIDIEQAASRLAEQVEQEARITGYRGNLANAISLAFCQDVLAGKFTSDEQLETVRAIVGHADLILRRKGDSDG